MPVRKVAMAVPRRVGGALVMARAFSMGYARGDRQGYPAQGSQAISIHAPTQGATDLSALRRAALVFQFTPLRKGRLILSASFLSLTIFQFTPLRKGRLDEVQRIVEENKFQFTPLRKGRPNKATSKP